MQRLGTLAVAMLGGGFALEAQAQGVQRTDRLVVGNCAPYEARLPDFERFVRTEMTEKKIPGLVAGFFKDDCTWLAAFGSADIDDGHRDPAARRPGEGRPRRRHPD